MRFSLYEIPLELERAMAIESEGGEPIDVAEQDRRLKEFLSSSEDALEKAMDYVAHLEMEVGEIDKRMKALKAKKESRELAIERLKTELLYIVDQVMGGQFKTVEKTAYGRDNRSFPVEVNPEANLSTWDEKFIKKAPDTAAIRQAFKEGNPIPADARCYEKVSRSLVIR